MIVTLAGHVDHGKTSIVRRLTGVDTDRLEEEKRRGVTIDLGFAYAELGGARIGFVDVPGHHRFIHNMVAGVAAHQFALFVVAADDGVMPQSIEHLHILRLLGLTAGVIAVNKIDRASQARIAAVHREIRALAAGSFLADADIVDISCATGAGFDALRRALAAAARNADADAGPDDAPFRLAVDRAFTVRGSGAIATGTVASGAVAVDGRLVLGNSGKAVRVRSLHVQNAPSERARAGDRAAINLSGIAAGEVRRGDWLLAPDARQPTERLAIRLAVLDDFPRPVKHNAPLHVYHATSHAEARLLPLGTARLSAGDTADADLLCQTPLHAKAGDRIVLRDRDLQRTLGGGAVLDLAVPRARRRAPQRRERLARIDPRSPERTLAELGAREAVDAAAFARAWNLAPARVAAAAESAGLTRIGDRLLHPDLAAGTSAELEAALDAHHRADPHSDGASADALCGDDPLRRLLLEHLAASGRLRRDGGRYALRAHRAALPDSVRDTYASVEPLLDCIQPPTLGDIAKRLGRSLPALEQDMRALPAFGLAVRIGASRYYLPNRLRELAATAERLAAAGPFTARQFRDAAGIGRNAAIAVLEHFDAKRFTHREGDLRRLGKAGTRHRF